MGLMKCELKSDYDCCMKEGVCSFSELDTVLAGLNKKKSRKQ